MSPFLRRRRLEQNLVLARAEEPVVNMVLPITAVISVLVELADGARAETRTVGREGGFGLLHALGSVHSFENVIVQVPGEAFLVDCREVAALAERSPSLVTAIVRHAQAAWVQSARSVARNAFHDARSRFCRWLLITQDRVQSDQLRLTQEHLSIMLCVQRTTVTAIAQDLQDQGAISYRRGRIQLLDRQILLAASCECYARIERDGEAVLSDDGKAAPYLGPA